MVSRIIPDDEMPYTDSGERVEVILNALNTGPMDSNIHRKLL